ncbi:hypothetical protein CL634_09490 [bacterium]|nr:hypothetical protein [bacterium]|tara:strand:+ start:1032 stop:1238 length:207 start_codon:yes stop_codon:yes gene_type:complete
MTIEAIIFYILLIDSFGANAVSWGDGRKWYQKNFRIISRNFPATKGWTTYYFVLVVFIGIILYRYGAL